MKITSTQWQYPGTLERLLYFPLGLAILTVIIMVQKFQ